MLEEALNKWGIADILRREVKLGGRRKFDSADIVKSLVLLMAAGGDCVDDIELLRADKALERLVDREFPSAETVRQSLDLFHEQGLVEQAQQSAQSNAFVPEESERLKGLHAAIVQSVQEAQRRFPMRMATLDVDATILESHKEAAKPHYKNGLGYQPMIAVWAEQGLVVDDQFRDGNVPAHFDALGVAKRAFAALPLGIEVRRLRADKQMYSVDALSWLASENIEFAVGIIKREGFLKECLAKVESEWQHLETRSDSRIDVSEVAYRPEKMGRVTGLRYIGIRLTPLQGEMFDADRTVRYLGVVTNRQTEVRELLKWYWAKAGTVEQVHDVMKNELGAGVPPSGRFGANAAWYRTSSLAFNMLSILRRLGDETLHNARPKKLRLHLFAMPVVLVQHARKLLARVSEWLMPAKHVLRLRTAL